MNNNYGNISHTRLIVDAYYGDNGLMSAVAQVITDDFVSDVMYKIDDCFISKKYESDKQSLTVSFTGVCNDKNGSPNEAAL